MKRNLAVLINILALLVFVGCHIKKNKSTLNGYTSDVSNMIADKCANCHSGGIADGDLGNIDNANTLISQGYIAPGYPHNSVFYTKLTNPSFGARMPYGGPYLTPNELNKIASWISSMTANSGACIPRIVGGTPSFSVHVRPLLENNLNSASANFGTRVGSCIHCHNLNSGGATAPERAARWDITSTTDNTGYAEYDRIVGNGVLHTGPLVIPGDPCNSRLYRRISQADKPTDWPAGETWTARMPKLVPGVLDNRHFTEAEMGIIYTWILNGAPEN